MNQNELKQSNAKHNNQAAWKLIFDSTPIIVVSWKLRFKIFEYKCLCNQ